MQLDWNAAKYQRKKSAGASGGQTWVKYSGPLGGEGWKNVTTGQVIYGGADPNEQGADLHKRVEEARKRRQQERQQSAPPPAFRREAFQITPRPPVDQRVKAQRAAVALQVAHGSEAVRRMEELANIVQEALDKIPQDKKDLREALKQKMMQVREMSQGTAQTPQERAVHAKQGGHGMPAGPPGKPQSPFLPKRGTS